MKEEKRKVYYLFSPFLRIFHWVMVLSIVTLFITGLLITKPVTVMGIEPTYTSMSMDWVRNIHFIAAFTFCAAFILRIYGYTRVTDSSRASGRATSTAIRLTSPCTTCC